MGVGGLFSIMYCTNCGKELPSTDARFCMECGTAVETEPICSKCGSVLPYFVKYCPKCGEKTKGLVFDNLVFWNAKFDKLKLLNIYAPYIYMESACCQHVILQNIHKAELDNSKYVFIIVKSATKNNLIFLPIGEQQSQNIIYN